jgi:(p)ppGpp synthase/HD superfamily hydrolase
MVRDQFIEFCYHQHDVVCNQKYAGELPYSFHLKMVMAQATRFQKLLSDSEFYLAILGAAGHDLIEDARVSYNDIKQMTAQEIAEIIFLCTENKGRSRAERKNASFYKTLCQNKLALFVKLCDIRANMLFSYSMNSSMFEKYRVEWEEKVSVYIMEYTSSETEKQLRSIIMSMHKIYDLQ